MTGQSASFPARDPVKIRLVGRNSCYVYAEFVANPGSSWAVRMREDGTITAEEVDGLEASLPGGGFDSPAPCSEFADAIPL